jgi:glycerol-3-phosphate dehydrogenase (NAD(P)+)
MNQSVTVLGAGAWGTAIATVLAHNNFDVTLWCHEPEVGMQITEQHVNKNYLPDIQLSEKIKATCNLATAIKASEFIFEAIPVQFLRPIAQEAKNYFKQRN